MAYMVFVADDLGAWPVSALADGGRRRIAALVLGTEEERALVQAASTAIRLTSREQEGEDGERAEQLAAVIGQVSPKVLYPAVRSWTHPDCWKACELGLRRSCGAG